MKTPAGLPPARAATYAILERALPVADPRRGADIQAAIDQILPSLNDPRDKALATELSYGFCRRLGFVREVLDRYLDKPRALPPVARRLLEMAVQELLFTDSVPAYATVNWCAEALKKDFAPALAGLANAVLRRMDRERDQLYPDELQARRSHSPKTLAQAYSLPLWLAETWLADYGQAKALDLARTQWRPAPVGVRVNAAKPGADELAKRLAGAPGVIWTQGPGLAMPPGAFGPELADLEAKGLVSRQSAAGQWLLARLDARNWPRPIWDACCGRGGKTMYLAEQGGGPILASDTNLRRLRGCARESVRLGHEDAARVLAASGLNPPFGQPFGTVLLDAPCSGLGVLARRPDAKWKRSPKDISDLAALQARLLDAAWDVVRPGGLLVYMTCTATAAENEGQVDAFLSRHAGATVVRRMDTGRAELGEYFFAAILQRSHTA